MKSHTQTHPLRGPDRGDAGERRSAYSTDCNMVALTLAVYKVEDIRSTNGGTPVRTVRCLRRDGLNRGQTVFVDVWLWKDLAAFADQLRPGTTITVTGKLIGLDAYLDAKGKPAATITISASGATVAKPLGPTSDAHHCGMY